MNGFSAGGDPICLECSSVSAMARWWIETFGCQQVPMPDGYDPLPSEIALRLPGDPEPSVFLSDRTEAQAAHAQRSNSTVPVVFCKKLGKTYEQLLSRGLGPSPIQDDGSHKYFEVRTPEGHVLEVCED